MTLLVDLAQTCGACPEQWEGETADGRFIYLRHRHGYGCVSIGPTVDAAVVAGWGPPFEAGGRTLLEWEDADWDGMLRPGALAHILYIAGFDVAPEVELSIATSPDADDFIAAAAELGIHLTTPGEPQEPDA